MEKEIEEDRDRLGDAVYGTAKPANDPLKCNGFQVGTRDKNVLGWSGVRCLEWDDVAFV